MERRKFTRELKLEAVKLIQERGVTVFYFLRLPPSRLTFHVLSVFGYPPTCSETAFTLIRTSEQPLQNQFTCSGDHRTFPVFGPMNERVCRSLLEFAII